jgi:hypothetical protein
LESREVDKPVYAGLLGHMGAMAYRQGDLDTARSYCEDSLEAFTEIEGVTEIGYTLAKIYTEVGEVAEAFEVLGQTVDMFERLGLVTELREAENLLLQLQAQVEHESSRQM